MGSVYTVRQVNNYIRNMISQDFLLAGLSVTGEVSNCKYHHSGHVYFTLKDEKAAISCVMFAGNRAGLAFLMRDGDKVVVTGTVELYERTGVCQLYAKKITLAGAGALYEKFLALKKELEEMGMFDPAYKKPIPPHVKRIGVVTAPTGAAIRDIQNIVRRRNPGIQIILYPALVQGEGAAASIVRGIRMLDAVRPDVLIVGRGGGSIEDLWAFNEEIVARAIFDCETPVISAVGHETDVTIADFAADLRAPTPSAAAELASENIFDTIEQITEYDRRLERSMRNALRTAQLRTEQYRKRVEACRPSQLIARYRLRLSGTQDKMKILAERTLENRKYRFRNLCTRLEDLSPLKRLSAGFSYVDTPDGKALRSVSQVRENDLLNVHVADGTIQARVTELSGNEFNADI